MESINRARNANMILMTSRNKQVSVDWLRGRANVDAPDMPERCLHP
jgi:hypothetical protein